jgi:hypothetical protein
MLLVSCDDKSQLEKKTAVPQNSKLVTTTLRDSLGSVTFYIPNQLDTFFTWTNHSDCGKPCAHEQYRYQRKVLPIFKETGFYYIMPDIDLDQFSVIHSAYFPFRDIIDTAKNFARHGRFVENLSSDYYSGKVVRDTIEDTATKKHFTKVASLTTIKGNDIEFHYELKSKDTIDRNKYFMEATEFLRTIQIDNGI